ncbi:hypothetical protein ACLOJK_018992 [Asimina triloba]
MREKTLRSMEKMDDAIAGDGLQLRWIWRCLVVSDLLDSMVSPSGASPMLLLIDNKVRMTTPCMDGEDARPATSMEAGGAMVVGYRHRDGTRPATGPTTHRQEDMKTFITNNEATKIKMDEQIQLEQVTEAYRPGIETCPQ